MDVESERRKRPRHGTQRDGAATKVASRGIIAAKRRKNTKAPAQVARAPIGAMETPDTTFEISSLFAANPALEIFVAREDFEET